jgi:hypothetical protein
MSITFSSCFYIINSKFAAKQYIEWMNNFISIVNNFNLVIYTDENVFQFIDIKNNPKIKIIIKPMEKFYNYKYKDFWITNHSKNILLNDKSCWELNMLWSEKISFVKETIEQKYFNTDFYGWCDIGYFRNRKDGYIDTPTTELVNWPNNDKINLFDKTKIVYACINNNNLFIYNLVNSIKNKNKNGLPLYPISPYQNSIAGGFFILHKNIINWWFNTFDSKLALYFNNNYLVKDDQIILADCIFSNMDNFTLFKEYNPPFDNWFMFQRLLN